MRTWAVIYNPASGTFSSSKLEAVASRWQEGGVRTTLLPSDFPGHAIELARSLEHVERVVAYGGDGTLNEVAYGLLGRGIPLMFLPGGTANVMAHELGISGNPVRAAPRLLASEPVAVRPGMVGGRPFLLMAGFGFDALAVALVTKRLKERLGKLAYVVTAARALASRNTRLRVTTRDGEEYSGVWAVGARAKRYGGSFSVHPRAGLFEPKLGLVVVAAPMIAPFALTHLAMGFGFSTTGVRLAQPAAFKVESEEPIHAHVDGEVIGRSDNFDVKLAPETIPFCIPSHD